MAERDPYNPDQELQDTPTPPKQDLPAAPIDQAAPASTTPQTPWNREQFRDTWMATGNNLTRQNDVLKQYGITLDQAGRTTLPTGEQMDLRIGAKSGQNLAGWTGIGPTAGNGSGGDLGTMSGGGAMGSGGGTGSLGDVRSMLMQILNRSQQPIDPNSAEVKAPLEAANLEAQRGLDAERKALAERLYAEGGGSGTNELQQGMQQAQERTATGLAGIRAQLLQRAQEQRQSQLQQALALAVQSGDAQAAREIQMEMARMSNALGQAELGQRASQWNDQFGLNAAQFQYLRDRDLANAALGQ